MKVEDVITNKEAREFMDPRNARGVAPTHDAWLTQEIERRLAKRAEGNSTYRSLDDVMSDYGFHAR